MKKILLTALVVLMLFTLAACKKSSPVDLFKQIESVALANGANSSDPDDCTNAMAQVKRFYYANIQDWKNSIKEMKAEGKSCDQVWEILRIEDVEDGRQSLESLESLNFNSRCAVKYMALRDDICFSLYEWMLQLYEGKCSI